MATGTKEGLARLLETLDEKSRAILWHLWWHRHAEISELRNLIDAPSDFEVLHKLKDVINEKSKKIWGKPVVSFERSKIDPLTGEKVLFSWWLLDEDVPTPTGSLVDVFDVFEEREFVTVIAHLPAQVEVDGHEIACRNGVLRVRLRKAEQGGRDGEEKKREEEHEQGVVKGMLSGLGKFIPGLDELVQGLERSEAFQERLRTAEAEIERRLKEGLAPTATVKVSQRTFAGGQVPPQREEIADVFDEGDALKVIVELPGVEESDLKAEVKAGRLVVSAQASGRKYRKEIELPCLVKDIVRSSYKNGVLQVILEKEQE